MSDNKENEKPEKANYTFLNWASTIIGIMIGLLALVGWLKESGKGDAVEEQLVAQTKTQWELRQQDQITINNLRIEVAKLQVEVQWLKNQPTSNSRH